MQWKRLLKSAAVIAGARASRAATGLMMLRLPLLLRLQRQLQHRMPRQHHDRIAAAAMSAPRAKQGRPATPARPAPSAPRWVKSRAPCARLRRVIRWPVTVPLPRRRQRGATMKAMVTVLPALAPKVCRASCPGRSVQTPDACFCPAG